MQNPFDTLPPPMLVAVIATVSWAIVAVVAVVSFFRYRLKRLEQQKAGAIPSEVSGRLARIENAVESIAVEVERISENQRFLTKLQAERAPLPAVAASAPDRR